VKRALIFGITGQDGSYLAELLLEKGYEVHGVIRRASTFNTGRIAHLYRDAHEDDVRLLLHYGDLSDGSSVAQVIDETVPDEIYNLAAQSHVRVSFDQPVYTADIVATGALRILEAIRHLGIGSRFYQAGSAEMFGASPAPQNEQTPFSPQSPYAISKVAAYWYTRKYREAYGLHASNGILFNHESERRGETFVTRKITRGLARIKLGLQQKLYLGNLDAVRDWGHAIDYVRAMWMILQALEPADYVVATGQPHSVRGFLDVAEQYLDLDWRRVVEHDPRYDRPAEVSFLQGDPAKIVDELGWRPTITFTRLVRHMVDHDLALARQEQMISGSLAFPRGYGQI